MDVQEVRNSLLEELTEEMDGAVEYHQLAVALKDAGKAEWKFVMQIALDEMSHAKWICEYLHESGVAIPEEVENRYTSLKDAHRKLS